MRKHLTLTLYLSALLAGGCAWFGGNKMGQPLPRAGQLAVTCKDQAQCEEYWHRTKRWIAENSRRPVRDATDWIILTEDGGTFGVALTYRITRWPGPNNSGEIRFEAGCSYFLPCSPSPAQALEQFRGSLSAP